MPRDAPKGLPLEKSFIAQSPKDYIMLFYGPPGVGKTELVDTIAPRVLFLSTDRGTRYRNALRIECSSWKKFESTLEKLESAPADLYDIVCIDHVDDWANMAENALLEKLGRDSLFGDYGKTWKAYKNMLQGYLTRLLALKYGVVGICHETIKKITTRAIETDRTMPDLGKSAWKLVIPIADLVGYCGFQYSKEKKKEIRILQTQPTEAIYAKDRTRRARPESGIELLNGARFISTFKDNDNGEDQTPTGTGTEGHQRPARGSRRRVR